MPAYAAISIYRGDSYELYIRVRTSDPDIYVDLTGGTVHSQIRPEPNSRQLITEFLVTILDQTDPDTMGGVVLGLTPQQTSQVTRNGAYDVRIFWPDDTVETVLAGPMTLIQDVTRNGIA
jgi:hypothetical protein